MRLQGLFHVGAKLAAASGFLGIAVAVSGLQSAWLDWALTLVFLGGVTDIAIATAFNALSGLRDDDGRLRLAFQIDESGIRLWQGDDAREHREEYREARERGAGRPAGIRYVDGVPVPVAQVDDYLRWAYPAGLSSRAPYPGPGAGYWWDAAGGYWAQTNALSESWASEKRLVTPVASVWREAGVEFPEQPAYAYRDRYGVSTPPFPVHFRTEPETHFLADGVRMEPAVMSCHTDSGNPGCPVCETWEREWGVFHG